VETIVKTRKVGGSVMATFPKNVVEALDIKGNDLLKVDVEKVGKDFFGRLKGIGKFTSQDEMKTHD